VPEVDEDVVPGVERRLEVDERDVERPFVDLVGRLERRDEQPVDREQDDDRPADQQYEGEDLRRRRQVRRGELAERVLHTTSVTRRRTKLTYTVAMTV